MTRRRYPFSLDDLGIPAGPGHPCPYLESREARERAFRADRLPPGLLRDLMDHGWRRSGNVVYKPACVGCQECRPIRVPVRQFVPDRSMRRALKRNADIVARVLDPVPTQEKFELFVRYQEGRHTGTMCTQWDEYCDFLYSSPVHSLEFEFRLAGRFVGASIVDLDEDVLSAVYTYFDPGLPARGLGTWAILWGMEYARREGFQWYYSGFYIADCAKMNYKTRFKPCELGDSAGHWSSFEEPTETQGEPSDGS